MTSDKARENCGIVAVYSPSRDAVATAIMGMMSVQHRGQEGAGIVASNGETLTLYKGSGFASGIFTESVVAKLNHAKIAIGHCRYSTAGYLDAVQPFVEENFALAHNGNLTNVAEIINKLSGDHEIKSDTWAALKFFVQAQGVCWEEKLRASLPKLRGAFSFVAMSKDKLFVIRDPWGFRPLVIGRLRDGGWVIASETCAFESMEAAFVREVMPGEGITIDEEGLGTFYFDHRGPLSRCIFEYVYIARPDSRIFGQEVHSIRKRCGIKLYQESPVEADVLISIPHSGDSATRGYGRASGIAIEEGVFANRYVGRAFIEPLKTRKKTTRIKYGVIRSDVEGKRVCAVDDSIVRGDASTSFVRLLREYGAKEVHLRIASPPLKFPCFYGVDFATKNELIGDRFKTIEEIRKVIGADSLAYLSFEGLVEAVTGIKIKFKIAPEDVFAAGGFCGACFTGKYPVQVEDVVDKEDHENIVDHYQFA